MLILTNKCILTTITSQLSVWLATPSASIFEYLKQKKTNTSYNHQNWASLHHRKPNEYKTYKAPKSNSRWFISSQSTCISWKRNGHHGEEKCSDGWHSSREEIPLILRLFELGLQCPLAETACHQRYEYDPGCLSMDHLLWGLMLLKLYNLETPNSSFAGVDEKTFRKWSYFAIECIADLHTEVVSKAFYIFLIQCLLICCFTFRFSLKTGLNRILVKIVCSALTV